MKTTKTKRTKHPQPVDEGAQAIIAQPAAEAPAETVMVTVPVATAEEIEAAEEARWEEIEAARKSGQLKGRLIAAVRVNATARVEDEDDDDGRWSKVKLLSDEEIWRVIEWCDTPRGAINLMSRAAKTLPGTKPDAETAPEDVTS